MANGNGIPPMANGNSVPLMANGNSISLMANGNNIPPMANGNGVPPSPSQQSSITDDLSLYDAPDVMGTGYTWNGHGYGLQIVQQPVRARMCGFGDKVGEYVGNHTSRS